MKIAIDIGHNLPVDGGARGIVRSENELTLEVGQKLIALLEREGHQVVNCLPKNARNIYDSLGQRCAIANKSRADLFASIHFNALNGKAYGSEVFVYSNKAFGKAKNVLSEITKLQYFNRGVKYGNYYVLRNTNMPAMLIECCFCDSVRDMDLYDPVNMAMAIKNGLLGKSGHYLPAPKTQFLTVSHHTWLKGSVEQAKNLTEVKRTASLAHSRSQKLKENEKLILNEGNYTIVGIRPAEEGHYYVRLKSGAEGFVYCAHAQISKK